METPPSHKMHRSQHYLTQNQIERLREISAETGIGVSEHMRRALDEYLEKYTAPVTFESPGVTR